MSPVDDGNAGIDSKFVRLLMTIVVVEIGSVRGRTNGELLYLALVRSNNVESNCTTKLP